MGSLVDCDVLIYTSRVNNLNYKCDDYNYLYQHLESNEHQSYNFFNKFPPFLDGRCCWRMAAV